MSKEEKWVVVYDCTDPEVFAVPLEDAYEILESFSGYGIGEGFDSEQEAKAFASEYNSHLEDDVVHLNCCQEGCYMSRMQYYRWKGGCAYK